MPRSTKPRASEDRIADALADIADHMWSPNSFDSNFEPANLVDALDKIGRGTHRIGEALERIAVALESHSR